MIRLTQRQPVLRCFVMDSVCGGSVGQASAQRGDRSSGRMSGREVFMYSALGGQSTQEVNSMMLLEAVSRVFF